MIKIKLLKKKINNFYKKIKKKKSVIIIIIKRTFVNIGVLTIVYIGNLTVHDSIKDITFFQLGLYPNTCASVIIQAILIYSPKLKEQLSENNSYIKQWFKRLLKKLTLFFNITYSIIILFKFGYKLDLSIFDIISVILWLMSGHMSLLWLSGLITKYGLGNGKLVIASIEFSKQLITSINLIKELNINRIGMNINYIIIITMLFIIYINKEYLYTISFNIPFISVKDFDTLIKEDHRLYLPLSLKRVSVLPHFLTVLILKIIIFLFSKVDILDSDFILFVCCFFYFPIIININSSLMLHEFNFKNLVTQFQIMNVKIPNTKSDEDTIDFMINSISLMSMYSSFIISYLLFFPFIIGNLYNIKGFSNLDITAIILISNAMSDISQSLENIYYSDMSNYENIS